jgi:hypothetical protein
VLLPLAAAFLAARGAVLAGVEITRPRSGNAVVTG